MYEDKRSLIVKICLLFFGVIIMSTAVISFYCSISLFSHSIWSWSSFFVVVVVFSFPQHGDRHWFHIYLSLFLSISLQFSVKFKTDLIAHLRKRNGIFNISLLVFEMVIIYSFHRNCELPQCKTRTSYWGLVSWKYEIILKINNQIFQCFFFLLYFFELGK